MRPTSLMRYAIALASVLLLLGLTHSANAQTFFPNSTTINYAVIGNALVGYDNDFDPSSPTVNVVDGGSISNDMQVANKSTVNVSGGSIKYLETGQSDSTINVTGGTIYSMDASTNSTVNVRGGNISILYALEHGTLNLFGAGVKGDLIFVETAR